MPTAAHKASPIRRVGVLPHAHGVMPTTSENWAGYDVVGGIGSFTSVSASWVQPTIQPNSSTDTSAVFWVGLDGDSSSTVEQIGTGSDSQGGAVSYYVWYEMYPGPMMIVPMSIGAGEQFSATVSSDGAGSFTLTIWNDFTHESYSTTQYSAAAQLSSAEVVAEAPARSDGTLYPLSQFDSVGFTDCAVNGNPIGSFTANLNGINMVLASGYQLATTSELRGARYRREPLS